MRALFLTVFLIAILGTSAFSADVLLPKDKPLDALVTLDVKGESLTDLMKILENKTRVRLKASREVADQKVTIFVDDKPLRDIMLALADLFGYRWGWKEIEGRKVYTIWQDRKSRETLEDQWKKAVDKAWDDIDAQIAKEMQKALGGADKSDKTACVLLYKRFPSAVVDAFRNGMHICYSSLTDEEEWKLPEEIRRQILDKRKDLPNLGSKIESTTSISSGSVGTVTFGTGDNDESIVGIELCNSINRRAVQINASIINSSHLAGSGMSIPIISSRVSDFIPQPKESLPEMTTDEMLGKKISITGADVAKESAIPEIVGDSKIYANRSDLLAILHKKVGLQTIADHYSMWNNWKPITDASVLGVINSFKDDYYLGANMRWDGKLLLARTKDILGSDEAEIPDRILKPIQKVYQTQGWLGLDDMAQLNILNNEQISSFRLNSRFLGFDQIQQFTWSPALAFYGILSVMQRKDLLDRSLSVNTLNEGQRQVLSRFLSEDSELSSYRLDRIGIYKDGKRVDMPQTQVENNDPVSVQLLSSASDNPIYYYKDRTYPRPNASRINASSFDEAWKSVQNEHPDALKENLYMMIRTNYTMVALFQDGSDRKRDFIMYALTSYDKISK